MMMQNYTLEFNEAVLRSFHCKLWLSCINIISNFDAKILLAKLIAYNFTLWSINNLFIAWMSPERCYPSCHLNSNDHFSMNSQKPIKWRRKYYIWLYDTEWNGVMPLEVLTGLSLSPSLTHRKDHRKIIEIIAIIMGASAVSDVKCFIRHRQLAGMNYRMRSPSLFRTQPLSLEWASRIKMKIPYLFLVWGRGNKKKRIYLLEISVQQINRFSTNKRKVCIFYATRGMTHVTTKIEIY